MPLQQVEFVLDWVRGQDPWQQPDVIARAQEAARELEQDGLRVVLVRGREVGPEQYQLAEAQRAADFGAPGPRGWRSLGQFDLLEGAVLIGQTPAMLRVVLAPQRTPGTWAATPPAMPLLGVHLLAPDQEAGDGGPGPTVPGSAPSGAPQVLARPLRTAPQEARFLASPAFLRGDASLLPGARSAGQHDTPRPAAGRSGEQRTGMFSFLPPPQPFPHQGGTPAPVRLTPYQGLGDAPPDARSPTPAQRTLAVPGMPAGLGAQRAANAPWVSGMGGVGAPPLASHSDARTVSAERSMPFPSLFWLPGPAAFAALPSTAAPVDTRVPDRGWRGADDLTRTTAGGQPSAAERGALLPASAPEQQRTRAFPPPFPAFTGPLVAAAGEAGLAGGDWPLAAASSRNLPSTPWQELTLDLAAWRDDPEARPEPPEQRRPASTVAATPPGLVTLGGPSAGASPVQVTPAAPDAARITVPSLRPPAPIVPPAAVFAGPISARFGPLGPSGSALPAAATLSQPADVGVEQALAAANVAHAGASTWLRSGPTDPLLWATGEATGRADAQTNVAQGANGWPLTSPAALMRGAASSGQPANTAAAAIPPAPVATSRGRLPNAEAAGARGALEAFATGVVARVQAGDALLPAASSAPSTQPLAQPATTTTGFHFLDSSRVNAFPRTRLAPHTGDTIRGQFRTELVYPLIRFDGPADFDGGDAFGAPSRGAATIIGAPAVGSSPTLSQRTPFAADTLPIIPASGAGAPGRLSPALRPSVPTGTGMLRGIPSAPRATVDGEAAARSRPPERLELVVDWIRGHDPWQREGVMARAREAVAALEQHGLHIELVRGREVGPEQHQPAAAPRASDFRMRGAGGWLSLETLDLLDGAVLVAQRPGALRVLLPPQTPLAREGATPGPAAAPRPGAGEPLELVLDWVEGSGPPPELLAASLPAEVTRQLDQTGTQLRIVPGRAVPPSLASPDAAPPGSPLVVAGPRGGIVLDAVPWLAGAVPAAASPGRLRLVLPSAGRPEAAGGAALDRLARPLTTSIVLPAEQQTRDADRLRAALSSPAPLGTTLPLNILVLDVVQRSDRDALAPAGAREPTAMPVAPRATPAPRERTFAALPQAVPPPAPPMVESSAYSTLPLVLAEEASRTQLPVERGQAALAPTDRAMPGAAGGVFAAATSQEAGVAGR